MFRGKKASVIEKIRGINYLNLPSSSELQSVSISERRIYHSKSTSLFLMVIFGFLTIGFLYSIITAPDMLYNNIVLTSFISLFILGGGIYSIFLYRDKKPVIILTKEAIKLRKKEVAWKDVFDIYVHKQNDGDYDNHTLVIEFKRSDKEVRRSIDSLSEPVDELMKLISAYYNHWKMNNK